MNQAASVISDFDEWTKSVIFPLAVIILAGLLGWVVKCLKSLLDEFRATSAGVIAAKASVVTLEETVAKQGKHLDGRLTEIAEAATRRIDQVEGEVDRAHTRIDRVYDPR